MAKHFIVHACLKNKPESRSLSRLFFLKLQPADVPCKSRRQHHPCKFQLLHLFIFVALFSIADKRNRTAETRDPRRYLFTMVKE
jgi:hypothetical protein